MDPTTVIGIPPISRLAFVTAIVCASAALSATAVVLPLVNTMDCGRLAFVTAVASATAVVSASAVVSETDVVSATGVVSATAVLSATAVVSATVVDSSTEVVCVRARTQIAAVS